MSHYQGTTPRSSAPATRESDERNWRSRAACLREDPELFFPIGTTGPSLLQIEEAKAVCLFCTVKVQCLELARSLPATEGVWAGREASEITAEEKNRRRRAKDKERRRRAADAAKPTHTTDTTTVTVTRIEPAPQETS